MPRQRRFTKLHACHHVMLRGNAGRLIFNDDEDKSRFCLYMKNAAAEYETLIHAFCFMNNHVHLLLEPTKDDLYKCVHGFAGRYAQYFNFRHKLKGHLFQDRFRSILIEDGDYLKRVVRYIHLNPIRANLSADPQKYIWSSYSAYAGITEISWLEQKRVLRKFADTYSKARQEFILHTSKKMDAELDVSLVHESNQIGVFGSDDFTKEVTSLALEHQKTKIKLDDLMLLAATELKFSIEEIVSASREKRLVDARSILALAVQRIPELYLNELVHYLKRDSSTLSRLAKRAMRSADLSNQTTKLIQVASNS